MRLPYPLTAILLLALASPSLAQRDAAPPAPRTPSPSSPPVGADFPGLSDSQLAQVEAIIERSVSRSLQAQRDGEASMRQQSPAISGSSYPSSQGTVQYAQAQPVTYAAAYVQTAAPTTYVLVQDAPSPTKKCLAHLGSKLTALSQPRIRSMALAPAAMPTATVQLVAQAQPQAVTKALPVTGSPQNFGLMQR